MTAKITGGSPGNAPALSEALRKSKVAGGYANRPGALNSSANALPKNGDAVKVSFSAGAREQLEALRGSAPDAAVSSKLKRSKKESLDEPLREAFSEGNLELASSAAEASAGEKEGILELAGPILEEDERSRNTKVQGIKEQLMSGAYAPPTKDIASAIVSFANEVAA